MERCINSVINQSIGFDNIELILYDDASTDNSRNIILDYANKFDNIVPILSDENSGFPGKGRNEGIIRSSAEYLMFMDNDDEYECNMCKNLYEAIHSQNADIAACNYINIDSISTSYYSPKYRGGEYLSENMILFDGEEVSNFNSTLIWIKIYRKSIIIENDVFFPTSKLAEDDYFTYILLMFCKKLVYLKDYYGYIRHVQNDSVSHNLNYAKIKGIFDLSFEIVNKFKQNNFKTDFNWLWDWRIEIFFKQIMDYDPFYDKKYSYCLLEDLYNFEKCINFSGKLPNPLFNFANILLLKKLFGITRIYLKFVKAIFDSKTLRKMYRYLSNI